MLLGLKILRTFLIWGVLVTLCCPPSFASEGAAQAPLAKAFGPSISVRSSHKCSVIHSPRVSAGINDSYGYRVSGHNIKDLRESLKVLEMLKEENEAIAGGRLSITDLPMWSKESRAFVQEVRDLLQEMGMAESVDVKAHFVPARPGLIGALEKVRAFFPMRQDYEKPIRDDVRKGAAGAIIAETGVGGYAMAALPAEAAVPLLMSHFGLLGTFTALQRTTANWTNRSKGEVSGFLKQALIGTVFIANYKLTANWRTLYDNFSHGLFHGLEFMRSSTGGFLGDQMVTTVTQTVFFYVTFVKGAFRWQAIVSHSPELSAGSKRAMTFITPAIFTVSGPMVLWASTTRDVLFSMGPFDFNMGHVGLLALAAGGGVIAYRPEILTPTIPWIDRWIHTPLNSAGAKVSEPFHRAREKLRNLRR